MQLIGILLILSSLAVSFWWITNRGTNKGTVVTLCTLAVFSGLVMIFQERITELTVKGVGTIKTAVQQATSDAEAVAKLKERVENQSAMVELVANEASKAKAISEDVADKNKRAEEKLEILDKAVTSANATLDKLEAATEFTLKVMAAQNDDRKAFDTLLELANDKEYPFADRAQQAWYTIFEEHGKPLYLSGFKIPWAEGLDPSKLTLSDLSRTYQRAPAQLKPALLEYIWNRNNIPEIDRLDFMMQVMKTDPSLTAVEYAGRYFTSGTNQKIKPLAVERLSSWWEQHRQEFQDK